MLAGMDVRVSLVDFRMAYRAVDEVHRAGRGALERTAVAVGVRRAVVMAAVDRVEAALGGAPFFEARVRRSGMLTAAGDDFRRKAPRLIRAWEAMLAQRSDLARPGINARDKPGRKVGLAVRSSATMAELVAAVDRQGQRIDDVLASVEASRRDVRQDGTTPAGTKAANTMKIVLGILKESGADGIGSRELDTALQAAGAKSGTAETAKAVLRSAGLVRYEEQRWYLIMASTL